MAGKHSRSVWVEPAIMRDRPLPRHAKPCRSIEPQRPARSGLPRLHGLIFSGREDPQEEPSAWLAEVALVVDDRAQGVEARGQRLIETDGITAVQRALADPDDGCTA